MNDFDFLLGTWDVANRRLRKRLADNDEWDEFPSVATHHFRAFGGGVNVDEITFPTLGSSGLAVRLYDPDTELWSIHWAGSNPPVALEPPVVGRFTDGIGEFVGDDTHEGTPVRVRFIWNGITDTAAHWEQAFSADGGQTWETNWTMDFTRTGR